MTAAIEFWLVISAVITGSAWTFAAISGFVTAGMRDTSGSRFILSMLASGALSPLWPIALVVGVLVGLPLAIRGLWSEAEIPTPMARRAERRREHAIAVNNRVLEQAVTIARLEREVGIR